MMTDTISRQEAINAVLRNLNKEEYRSSWESGAVKVMKDTLEKMPTADRPQGEWIDKGWKGDWEFETGGRGNCWHEYECSECGFHKKGGKSNFCPNCGADMRKGE